MIIPDFRFRPYPDPQACWGAVKYLSSQILRVLSSLAETRSLLSLLHATSEIPSWIKTILYQLEPVTREQCCGSGSESGFTCFWASWIRIRIHSSEAWIRIRILLSFSKNSKKNIDFYCFVASLWLFTFEKLCKSTFKNMQKNFFYIIFLLASWRSMMKIKGSGTISQRHGSADLDPDPHQNVMDPQHCQRVWELKRSSRPSRGCSKVNQYSYAPGKMKKEKKNSKEMHKIDEI